MYFSGTGHSGLRVDGGGSPDGGHVRPRRARPEDGEACADAHTAARTLRVAVASLPNLNGLTVRARMTAMDGAARRPRPRAAPGAPPRAPVPAPPRPSTTASPCSARRGRQDGARRALGRRRRRRPTCRRWASHRQRAMSSWLRRASGSWRLLTGAGPRRRRGRDAAYGRQRRGRRVFSLADGKSPTQAAVAAVAASERPWSSSGRTATASGATPTRGAARRRPLLLRDGRRRRPGPRGLWTAGVKDHFVRGRWL